MLVAVGDAGVGPQLDRCVLGHARRADPGPCRRLRSGFRRSDPEHLPDPDHVRRQRYLLLRARARELRSRDRPVRAALWVFSHRERIDGFASVLHVPHRSRDPVLRCQDRDGLARLPVRRPLLHRTPRGVREPPDSREHAGLDRLPGAPPRGQPELGRRDPLSLQQHPPERPLLDPRERLELLPRCCAGRERVRDVRCRRQRYRVAGPPEHAREPDRYEHRAVRLVLFCGRGSRRIQRDHRPLRRWAVPAPRRREHHQFGRLPGVPTQRLRHRVGRTRAPRR